MLLVMLRIVSISMNEGVVKEVFILWLVMVGEYVFFIVKLKMICCFVCLLVVVC